MIIDGKRNLFFTLILSAASDNIVDRFLTSLELRFLDVTVLERFMRDFGAVTISIDSKDVIVTLALWSLLPCSVLYVCSLFLLLPLFRQTPLF